MPVAVPGTLLLGCGELATRIATLRARLMSPYLGVRRSPPTGAPAVPHFRLVAGDIADPAWWEGAPAACEAAGVAWPPAAALLSADPGVRRGRDNRIPEAAALAVAALPRSTRLVYTGTTAVYADAGGADVDETGAVDDADPAVSRLLAIERAWLAHPRALVLRVPAIVGPDRSHTRERLAAGERTVRGDLDRPFPFIHERDLADLVGSALLGAWGTGIMNAASPQRLTAREYFAAMARLAGAPMPTGDGKPSPSRWIDSPRLRAGWPDRRWGRVDE